MPNPIDDESVEYKLYLDAIQLLKALKEASASATTFDAKMKMALNTAKEFSAKTGKSLKEVSGLFRDLDETFHAFGSDSSKIWKQVGDGAKQVGPAADSGVGRAIRLVNILRIALGALVSIGIFQVIQAFTSLVRGAVDGLKEIEVATYNLINAERNLSNLGVDITPKGLDETIKKLQKLDPLLSRDQATELVSRVATNIAPNVGFNAKQISELSEAVAIFTIRNKALGYSADEVEKAIGDAYTTGKVSQGINKFGIVLDDQIVKEKAVTMHLVENAEAFDKLTGAQEKNIKAQAMLQLMVENTNKDRAHLSEYFKTADASFGIFQARVADILTEIGILLGPLLIKVFTGLGNVLEGILGWIEENKGALTVYVDIATKLLGVFAKLVIFVFKFASALGIGLQIAIKVVERFEKLISKIPILGAFVDKLMSAHPDIANAEDTPTGNPNQGQGLSKESQLYGEGYAEAVNKAEEDITDLMKEARDKRLDIERDYQRKLEDIARNYSQKLEDIARNTAQKTEDANRNYGQKIEDINRDANNKIAEAQEDAHKKELDAEAEFQRKLQELRQRFLFDLEDALHERDARQVLRLIRQYNFDKKALEDKRKQEQEESKLSLQHKLEDIEIERQQKLDAAKREHEERLAEIELYAQRERADAAIANRRALADARLDHQRKLQENREYLQRKLRDIAEAIAKEFQLTAAGAQAISSLLGSYFGAGGAVSQIFNGLQNSLSGMTQVGGSGAVSGNGSFSDFGSSFNTLTSGHGYGFAEGGTLIATRPTKAIFGEKGPEEVTFTPLGRVGRNVNQTFGGSGAGANGGSITLEVALSPDLEARIVDTSLENVALHLEKISRSK